MPVPLKKDGCALCKGPVDNDDYCFGCQHYICANCDTGLPVVDHDLDDHRPEPTP